MPIHLSRLIELHTLKLVNLIFFVCYTSTKNHKQVEFLLSIRCCDAANGKRVLPPGSSQPVDMVGKTCSSEREVLKRSSAEAQGKEFWTRESPTEGLLGFWFDG